jgi:methylglyoxal/glyoxal reductase
MARNIADTTTLRNGVQIPWLGLGTFRTPEGQEVEDSVRWALSLGYRHIDTAALYGNERGVGKAIRESGVPREQVFVTTKVWNDDIRKGADGVRRALEKSLRELGFDHVDLYLVHWPVKGHYKEAWQALSRIYADGQAKAIGVSNFLLHHLKDLMADAEVVPMVNQIEWHPRALQRELLSFCQQNRIQMEAWAPLMRGKAGDIPELVEIARKHRKTEAQVLLRWDLQHGVVTIPKSVRRERLEENAAIFDFALSAEDMQRIDGLDRNQRIGPDPDNISF